MHKICHTRECHCVCTRIHTTVCIFTRIQTTLCMYQNSHHNVYVPEFSQHCDYRIYTRLCDRLHAVCARIHIMFLCPDSLHNEYVPEFSLQYVCTYTICLCPNSHLSMYVLEFTPYYVCQNSY